MTRTGPISFTSADAASSFEASRALILPAAPLCVGRQTRAAAPVRAIRRRTSHSWLISSKNGRRAAFHALAIDDGGARADFAFLREGVLVLLWRPEQCCGRDPAANR